MMNFRDRSPNTMGSGGFDGDGGGGRGRGGRSGRFRGGGFRGGNFRRGDVRNVNDRPSPWKDANEDRFDNKNSGGFRGGGHFGSGFNDNRDNRDMNRDNRDTNRDNRDFGPNRDMNRAFQRGPNHEATKWNEPLASVKPTLPTLSPAAVSAAPAPARPQRTNDLEIIVTHKSLTKYAEFIEHRLKTNGFDVDILYPNEEVPLGRVLANIASRGTLYALVVTQLSEEHRSVTINVLYGQTQEHRNMPLDDALAYLKKNFEAFVKGERAPVISPLGAIPVTPAGIPLGEKHPELIHSILSNLIENRPLSVTQYDKLVGYLQEKRDRLYKSDYTPEKTKIDLQNRILGILASSENKLLDSKQSGLLPPTPQPNPSILNDSPTLQAVNQAVKDIVQNKFRGQMNLLGSLGPRI